MDEEEDDRLRCSCRPASPMRQPPACLFTFATAVCKNGKKDLPPRAATRFSSRLQTAAANFSRRASGLTSADAH
ncbi:MAG: hypothetical protein ABSC42_05605 [Tepidisphaeraceae bacterium]